MGAVVVALQVHTVGELDEGVDVSLHLPAGLMAAAPGQLVAHGGLDRLAQPRLAYFGEVEGAGAAKRRSIPHILVPLALRRHTEPTRGSGEGGEHRLAASAQHRQIELVKGRHLAGPCQLAYRAQMPWRCLGPTTNSVPEGRRSPPRPPAASSRAD